MRRISNILSILFLPLFVPAYGMALTAFLTIMAFLPSSLLWYAIVITFVTTGLLPMLVIFGLMKSGLVSDPDITKRTERLVPYMVVVFCYLVCGFFFYKANAPMWICMFFVGAAVATLINIIVNRWWKISAHGAAMGGLTALLVRIMVSHYNIVDMDVLLSAVVILSGLVLSARVFLKRHTLGQVLAGYANGFICVFFMSMIR